MGIKHNASPTTMQPGVPDSPSAVPCTCGLISTPQGLRGRPGYRCLSRGSIFATDRVTRMANRGLTHEQSDGVIECERNEHRVGCEPAKSTTAAAFATVRSTGYISSEITKRRIVVGGTQKQSRATPPRARPFRIPQTGNRPISAS